MRTEPVNISPRSEHYLPLIYGSSLLAKLALGVSQNVFLNIKISLIDSANKSFEQSQTATLENKC